MLIPCKYELVIILLVIPLAVLSGKLHLTRNPASLSQARDELLLFFPGTTLKPPDENYPALYDHAASLGFHVFSVDYPNDRTTGQLCSMVVSCYGAKRREVMFGGGSTAETDAGIVQFKTKLAELAQQNHTEGWGSFLTSSSLEPVWAKIVVSGHSQGAGHAILLGKLYSVAGVVQFAGTADASRTTIAGTNAKPAPWLLEPSATPVERIYGFVHEQDKMAVVHATWPPPVLNMTGPRKSYIDDSCCSGRMLYSKDPSFTCNIPPMSACNAHYMIMKVEYSQVWTYMLTRQHDTMNPAPSPSPMPTPMSSPSVSAPSPPPMAADKATGTSFLMLACLGTGFVTTMQSTP